METQTHCSDLQKGVSSNPANFRPITLEPVCLKILSSIVRCQLYRFLVKNNYIESEIQKGFWDNIPRTTEHTEMLTYMINHSRKRQRDLVITLIDLRNAFGEVHHSLLRIVLDFHHILHELRELILEMYRDFYVTIGTVGYTTCPIKLERRVLQGNCLSPLLFNLCFNTLIQTVKQRKVNCLGYIFITRYSLAIGFNLPTTLPLQRRAYRIISIY